MEKQKNILVHAIKQNRTNFKYLINLLAKARDGIIK